MTRREALRILFEAAAKDAAGVGTGIRSLPTEKRRLEIAQAIKLLWRKAYDFDPQDSDFLNMGLPIPEEVYCLCGPPEEICPIHHRPVPPVPGITSGLL